MKKSPPELPLELWLEIFSRLPPVEIYTTMLCVCPLWRRLIIHNRRSLPLIPTQCQVIDINAGEDCSLYDIPIPRMDPSVRYSFTISHERKRDKRERERCRMLRTLHVSPRFGDVMGEMEPVSRRAFNPLRVDSRLTHQCLSFMSITSLSYDVYERPRSGGPDVDDDRLRWSFVFLEKLCGNVNLRCASLRSLNPLCGWRFGARTRKLIANLGSLQSLELVNLRDAAAFIIQQSSTPLFHHLKQLTLRTESSHPEYSSENLTLISTDSEQPFLDGLTTNNKQPAFSFEAFSDTPSIVLDISLRDICDFVRTWRWSLKPWLFSSLIFNSTAESTELANRLGVSADRTSNDPSQKRFRVPHNERGDIFMEITCIYRGISTMWRLRVCDNSAVTKHRTTLTSVQRRALAARIA